MKTNEIICHGEATIFTASIPKTAKLKKINNSFVAIAPSETTGNNHVVDVLDGVDIYEDEKGTLYMNSKVPTQVRCVHPNRHDSITIPPGSYEFGTQLEYDPFTARMEKVRD